MKKLVLLFVAVMLSAMSFGQLTSYGFRPVMILPDTSTNFPALVQIGDLVYVRSTGNMYEINVAVNVSAKKDMNWILASAARYKAANLTAFNTHGTSFFLDTASSQTTHGNKGFFGTIKAYSTLDVTGNTTVGGTLGVTGTMTLPGSTTLSKTTVNANSVSFSGSARATDTLASAVVNGSTKVYSPAVVATTSLTLPGTNNTVTKTTANANSVTFAHSALVSDSLVSPVINGSTKIYSPSVAATTTLTLPGTNNTVTKTTANANSVTFAHSIAATDTAVLPVINGSTKIYSPSVAATTTLTLPGTTTITKTATNANSVTTSGSLYVGNGNDTLSATVINGVTKIYTPLSVPNQIKAGSTLLADTINFGTDATGSRNLYARKKITGIVAGDLFTVTPVMTTGVQVPGAGEFLGYYTATDSIVVSRVTATTAGLKVCIHRIAK